MRATTGFILFILIGVSFQQDAVEEARCDTAINDFNQACVSNFNTDPSNSEFCSEALGLSQCLDASCLDIKYKDAVRAFTPTLLRPGSCPICYDIPEIVTRDRSVCTSWGLVNVVSFDYTVQRCQQNITTLITNDYFTVTAFSNTTNRDRTSSTTFIFPGITEVRIDYHYCAVFSRSWYGGDEWDQRRIPTQGYFPHTIQITQNSTHSLIRFPVLNTEIILRKSGRYMAVGITTPLTSVGSGTCLSVTCPVVTAIAGPSTPPCPSLPSPIQYSCEQDLRLTNGSSSFGDSAIDAAIIYNTLTALGSGTGLDEVNSQKIALPIVLTVVSTGLLLIILVISCLAGRRSWNCGSFQAAGPILLFFGWLVLCLNAHALGIVYPFTGLVFVSMGLGILVLIAVFRITDGKTGVDRAMKAFLIMVLPQQFTIGVIGAVANEYYLFETQFWWGIVVLLQLIIGGLFLALALVKLYRKADKPVKKEKVRPNQFFEENQLGNEVPLEVLQAQQQPARPPQRRSLDARPPQRQSSDSDSGSGSASSSSVAPTKSVTPALEPAPQVHVIIPQEHVIQPQEHVIQPQHVIPPPQEHVIQPPQPQSHVIAPQPLFYGNATDAPPPPNNGGAFSPSPVDVYENPSMYMSAADGADPTRHMLKRAIKLSGVNMDASRENVVYAKIQELLQLYNLTGAIRGDEGASMRNDLAKDISEELKLYEKESMDELAYGLKEAILLWKEDNKL